MAAMKKNYVAVREHRILCIPCAKELGLDKKYGDFPDKVTDRELKKWKGWSCQTRCAKCSKEIKAEAPAKAALQEADHA